MWLFCVSLLLAEVEKTDEFLISKDAGVIWTKSDSILIENYAKIVISYDISSSFQLADVNFDSFHAKCLPKVDLKVPFMQPISLHFTRIVY